MKHLLWTLPILAFGSLFLKRQTRDHFSLSRITSTLEYHSTWDVPQPSNNELDQAFSQNYSYLGQGYQCFAFISEDQKYVIKFFRHHKWRVTPFEKLLNKTAKLERKKQRTFNRTFNSALIAHHAFQKQTGLIYIHLNKSADINRQISLTNEQEKKFLLNLDDYEFIVQRKATRIDEYLKSLKHQRQLTQAKLTITSLLNFIAYRMQSGYRDKDPHPIRNFGILDGEIMQIDIGGYERNSSRVPDYFSNHEIPKVSRKLLRWIEKHYPELSAHVQKEIDHILLENDHAQADD